MRSSLLLHVPNYQLPPLRKEPPHGWLTRGLPDHITFSNYVTRTSRQPDMSAALYSCIAQYLGTAVHDRLTPGPP